MKRLLVLLSIISLFFATTTTNIVVKGENETTLYSSIVGIGDSWAQGVATPVASSTERTYIKQASNTLNWNEHYFNGARGGWFTSDTLPSIKTAEEGNTKSVETHPAILDADVIVCHAGTNDMRSPMNYIPSGALGKTNDEASAYLKQQVNNSKNTVYNNLKQIITYIRGYNPSALIVMSGVYCNYTNAADTCYTITEDMTDDEKKAIYTSTYNYYIREGCKELNQQITDFSKIDDSFAYLDDDKVIGEVRDYTQTSAESGNAYINNGHPTDLGYKKMGDELVKLIRDFYRTDYPTFDHNTKVDLSMTEGASIRLGNLNGIRFYTNVDKAKVSKLRESGYTVELGTLIAPDDYLLNRTYTWLAKNQLAFNLDYSQYIDVKYNSNVFYENKDINFSGIVGSIVSIKESNSDWSRTSGNITRKFIARGYAKVFKDGKLVSISYSDNNYYNNTMRSLQQIATSLSETNNELYTTYKEYIEKWISAEK